MANEKFESKDELYACLHEFDDSIRTLYSMLNKIEVEDVKSMNLSVRMYGLLIKYASYLGMLMTLYIVMDHEIANEIKAKAVTEEES